MVSTRRSFIGGSAAVVAGLADCLTTSSPEGGADAVGSGGGDTEAYEVGHQDFQTNIEATAFPDMLYFCYVRSGWVNWPSLMQLFKDSCGVAIHGDDRSSGRALQHMRSHSNNVTHSGYNGSYAYGIVARNEGFAQAYKPRRWDKVPGSLKTGDGRVTVIRRVTTAVAYREDICEERGLDEPITWEGLLQPELMQDLTLQTPQTVVGLAMALSINNARGGSMNDLQPVIDYYERIQEGGAESADNLLAQFSHEEYATFIRYDYSSLDLKYNSDEVAEENVGVALLGGEDGNKGALNIPYGYALLEGAPNPAVGKLFMDYVLSPRGQQQFLDAYVRPIRSSELGLPEEFIDSVRHDRMELQVGYGQLVDQQEDTIQEVTHDASI